MKIFIRTDASTQIGTGHVMRCMALAKALRDKGAEICFLCQGLNGNLNGFIKNQGYPIYELPKHQPTGDSKLDKSIPAHASWLEDPWEQDMVQSRDAIKKVIPIADWLIVDHYALDHQWETGMRSVAHKIMAVDDIADRVHDCDLLLDQNYFQEPDKRYKGLLPEKCKTLLGPKYALLRPEFREVINFTNMRGNGVGRVLVYFGGNDPENITGMALEALCSPELSHLLVEIVTGPNNKHLEKLSKQVQNRSGARLHIQPEYFTELLLRSDLGVGAGGTTTWERLCLGLPSIVITVAKNQEPFAADLDKDGYITWLGRKEDITVTDIKNVVLSKISELKARNFLPAFPNPVDGLGAMRVAEQLIPSSEESLSLRKATMDDMALFFFWANDPLVRENAFQQKPIAWDDHVQWFTDKIVYGQTDIRVLQTKEGLPVGQIRFDIHSDTADIDYSLDPMVRGRGWSKKLLELGLSDIKDKTGNIAPMGKVKTENIPSRRTFQRLGFTEKIDGGVSVFHMS